MAAMTRSICAFWRHCWCPVGLRLGRAAPSASALDHGSGRDEFAILPTKPLQQPQDDSPRCRRRRRAAPTSTDPTPEADAIAALGGNAGGAGTRRRSGGGRLRRRASASLRTSAPRSPPRTWRSAAAATAGCSSRCSTSTSTSTPTSASRSTSTACWNRLRRAGIRTPAAPPEGAPALVVPPPPAGPSAVGPTSGPAPSWARIAERASRPVRPG